VEEPIAAIRDQDGPAASAPAPTRFADRLIDALHPAHIALALAVGVWSIMFVRLALLRQDRFGTFGFDLGIYDQGLWLLGHGRDPFVTVRGLELFGHHMNVFFLALAPFYRLGAGPEFLLAVQVVAQASGAIALFLLGRDVLHSRWAGVGLAAALLCNPTYQWLVWEFFHPDAVSIGPLLFAYWAARQRRWGWFTVAAVLAMSCKEDVALKICVLGLLIALRWHERPSRVALGLVVAAIGVLVPIEAGGPARIVVALCVAAGGTAIALTFGKEDRRWNVVGIAVVAFGALVPIASGAGWKLAIGAFVALAGLALALDRKPEWRIGLMTAAFAAGWFVIATRLLIPFFNGVGPFYDSFFPPELGASPTEMLRNAAHHPSRAYQYVDEKTRVSWYWKMLGPWAFMPLLNVRTLALAAPMITVDVLTAFPYTRDYRYHYSALVLVGCALATVETMAWIQRKTGERRVMLILLVLALLGSSVYSSHLWGASPIANNYRYTWPFHTDGATAVRDANVAQLPDDAPTSASYSFIAHIAHREKVYEFPVPWCNINWGVDGEHLDDPGDVQWLLVDRDLLGERDTRLLDDLLSSEFTVRSDRDGIVLAERTAPPTFRRSVQPIAFACEGRPSLR
jgi:uncharacterized membrane protein